MKSTRTALLAGGTLVAFLAQGCAADEATFDVVESAQSAVTAPSSAAVVSWNIVAQGVAARFGAAPVSAGVMAMTHLAIHDALNTITPRYNTYGVSPDRNCNASPEAAVAGAARKLMLTLLAGLPDSPAKTASITAVNTAFNTALGPLPYDAAEIEGIALGEAAALAILDVHPFADGYATPNLPYTRPAGPGVYQPTAPNFAAPGLEGIGMNAQPFALHSNDQYRADPGAIFDLTSTAYADEFNEVKTIGDATVRGAAANSNSEETNIARFWPGGGSNWNATARMIITTPAANPDLDVTLDLWEAARLFALMNVAEADAFISIMETKYTYNYWRPVNAIRWPDDGNESTESSPSWLPLLTTPNYPDYVCGLPGTTGADSEVLRQVLDTDDINFTINFNAPALALPAPMPALPAKLISRSFSSFEQARAESVSARVYAGIHFRSGCDLGVKQGVKVARFAINHLLRPLKRRNF